MTEEHELWQGFLDFYRQNENLEKMLFSAQKRLRSFADQDFIMKDSNGKYVIDSDSVYADAYRKLVKVLAPITDDYHYHDNLQFFRD